MSSRELISPDRPPLEAAQAALKLWFATRVSAAQTSEARYYDTFDGLLHSAGLTLSGHLDAAELERGTTGIVLRVQQLRGAAHAASAELEDWPSEPFRADAIPAGEARDLVSAETGVRVLTPIASIRETARTISVLDGLEKTVARVHVHAVDALRPDGTSVTLTPRLKVESLRGYESEFKKVYELFDGLSELREAQQPVVDEAVVATGGRPGGFNTSVNVNMRAAERADIVAARVLARLLRVLDATLPGTLEHLDPEFLHDYRVAIRRTRSVLKELPGVFPADEIERIKADFRWLQAVTGETRDLDVWTHEFDELKQMTPESLREHLEPLRSVLARRHATAREQMAENLLSARSRELRGYWGSLLEVLVLEDESNRPDAAGPVGELTAQRIRKVHHRMVKMGRRIKPESDPADYHALRKRGKELRYLLELFGVRLRDPEVVKPMIKTLKRLQDVLGHHQDREVQIDTLKLLARDVGNEPDGAVALMAVGALIDRLEADAAQARGQFAAVFKAFASDEQIKLIHQTFSA